MAQLPSYEEAVTGGHWLDLVAPYVSGHDYSRLCCVSRRFFDQFAPRLWNDPIQMVKLLKPGLHPSDQWTWYFHFVIRHAPKVRMTTRRLVTCLDFRDFALGSPPLFVDAGDRTFSDTLRLCSMLFLGVRGIWLDGHSDLNPTDFLRPPNADKASDDGSEPLPMVLSMARCAVPLPATSFESPYWQQLVYLDVSDLPDTARALLKQGALQTRVLRHLRILKLCRCKLDNTTAVCILSASRWLWSVDFAQNNLDDQLIEQIEGICFPITQLQTTRFFEAEGALHVMKDSTDRNIGTDIFDGLYCINESSYSGTFAHPDRYLADSPHYDQRRRGRFNGCAPFRKDSVNDVKQALVGGAGCSIPDWHSVRQSPMCAPSLALTHICLSGNSSFTVRGLGHLFHRARGYLEHFDCEMPTFPTPASHNTKLFGVMGRSHYFRPVFASNLQSLRVHHSLVTQIPTVLDPTKDTLANLEYAETILRERVELAFPQAFVPDLNPRLRALTLTGIPRISAGPLIDKLIHFLILASKQEYAIHEATASAAHRGPAILRGLRHIRFEFDPLVTGDDLDGGFDDLDAESLLNSAVDDFSFFGEAGWSTTVSEEATPSTAPTTAVEEPQIQLAHYPLPNYAGPGSDSVHDTLCWNGSDVAVSVWVGSGICGSHGAINAYMRNLAHTQLRADIQPASPDQIMCGVPAEAFVFNAAWDAIVSTGDTSSFTSHGAPQHYAPKQNQNVHSVKSNKNRRLDLQKRMRDVLHEIQQFRSKSRALRAAKTRVAKTEKTTATTDAVSTGPEQEEHYPSLHWSGTLEIMLQRRDDGDDDNSWR